MLVDLFDKVNKVFMPNLQEAAQQSGFLSDARILENMQATSSLPPEPTVPDTTEVPIAAEPVPATTPEPTAPSTEPIADPAPAEVSEDDFSADLPELPSPTPAEEPSEIPADSPLDASAPQWQHEAYKNLKSDPELSEDDKAQIAKLPPGQWTRTRRWSKDAKVLGKYRDANVPIQDVVGLLEAQDKGRTEELTSFAVGRMIDSPELSEAFAQKNPEVFSRLMVALATHNPKFLTSLVERQGFKVVRGDAINVDAALAELENDPMWAEGIKDTDTGRSIVEKLKSFAESAKPTVELNADELAAELKGEPSQDQAAQMEVANKINEAFETVRERVWLPAVADGLQAGGIKPATAAEVQKNPALANLKNLIYHAALRGMPGVLADWDEQSWKYGESKEGFTSAATELQDLVRRGQYDQFKDAASSLNEHYYDYGQRRANVPLVRNTYRFVERLLSEAPAAAPATPPSTPEQVTTPAPQGERKYQFQSDRIILERHGLGN